MWPANIKFSVVIELIKEPLVVQQCISFSDRKRVFRFRTENVSFILGPKTCRTENLSDWRVDRPPSPDLVMN